MLELSVKVVLVFIRKKNKLSYFLGRFRVIISGMNNLLVVFKFKYDIVVCLEYRGCLIITLDFLE